MLRHTILIWLGSHYLHSSANFAPFKSNYAEQNIVAIVNTGDVAAVAGYSDSSIATIIAVNLPDKRISLWVVGLAFLMVS